MKYGRLPDNFITKAEAAKLGWDPQKGNLAEVAPGKSIGGDIFQNREKLLPDAAGRVWREADINYTSGFRGQTGSSIPTTDWFIKQLTTIKRLRE